MTKIHNELIIKKYKNVTNTFTILLVIIIIIFIGGLLTTKHIFQYTETELRKKINLTAAAARRVFIEAAKISTLNVK